MCRLSLMNKRGAELLEREIGLDTFFYYLQYRMGGHGNGYALIKGGKRTTTGCCFTLGLHHAAGELT